jgi:hypothetical protein
MRFFTSALAWLQHTRRARDGRGGEQCDPLAMPLVWLNKFDALSPYDLFEGCQVVGASGSGKTSSAAHILRALFRANFGGIVLCAKPGEFEHVYRIAQETGAERRVVRFAPEEAWRYNPFAFELQRATRGAGLITNIVALILQAMECGGRGKNTGGDTYWQDALTELLTAAVHLVCVSTGDCQLSDVLQVIQTAPQSREDVTPESTWSRTSACFAMLLAAEKKVTTEAEYGDLAVTEQYFFRTFPELASKTRSIVVSSVSAMLSPMMRSPMRELFCTTTNIDPTACERGAIVVVDLPVKDFGSVGTFAQTLWKMTFQKAMEQRDIAKSPVPTFLWADESQYFVSSYDLQFLATARSSRVCTVYLTQNIPSYYEALGRDHQGQHKVDALLGNLGTKLWLANGDPTTNEHAAKMIAQTWQMRQGANQGYSSNMSQQGGSLTTDTTTSVNYSDNQGVSLSEQLAFQILPQEFTTLRTGGPRNNLLVDGIIFKPGRVWNATGTNFMRVTFKQQ